MLPIPCRTPVLKELTMHPYERWTVRRYLANALMSSRFAQPPRADGDIVTWIDDHRRLLDLPELAPKTLSSRRRLAIDAPMQLATWKAWRVAWRASPRQSLRRFRSASIGLRAHVCSLTVRAECSVSCSRNANAQVSTLVDAVSGRFGIRVECLNDSDLQPFLETRSERLELSTGGRLSELGLIEAHDTPRLSVVVRRLLSLPRFEARRVSDLLLVGEPASASLAWKDFEHWGLARSRSSDRRGHRKS